jgi:hypothetical protein
LTPVDKAVITTKLSLVFVGVSSAILSELHESDGIEAANLWNSIFRGCLVFCYVIANVWIFVPPWMRKRSGALQLANFSQSPETHHNELFDVDPPQSKPAVSALPPTVQKGSRYGACENQ